MPENLKWKTSADPDKQYLAAVSGGPDSMALLDQLVKRGYRVIAVHINYHIPGVSNLGENRMRKYCKSHKIRVRLCHVRHNGEGNFEAWARDFRYAWFQKTAEKLGCEGIFMGHQEDDLIETYMMQKEKNSVYSFWGLRPEGKVGGLTVYRPLLDNTKAELLEYVRRNGIPYYIDYTNELPLHRRNEIRLDTVGSMTAEERQKTREEIDAKNRQLEAQRAQDLRDAKCLEPFDPERYQTFPEEKRCRIIRRYLMEKGVAEAFHFSGAFLKELDRDLCSGKNHRMELGKNTVWDLDYGKLTLHEPAEPYCVVRKINRELRNHPEVWMTHEGKPVNGVYLTKEDFPVTVRPYREKDAIRMRYGTKRVSRFFIDRKVPRYEREMWPVMENCKGEIILVPGIGCDIAHYRLPYNCYLEKKTTKQ